MEPVAATKPSAAYGHSCSNCVKAKCKCVPREAGGSCERCYRIGKDCQPATFVRKRSARRQIASSNRTSKLEDKLDSLVTLLQAQHAAPNPAIATVPSAVPTEPQLNSLPTRPSHGSQQPAIGGSCLKHFGRGPIPTPPTTTSSTSPASDSFQPLPPDPEETFDLFRTRFLPYFPMMHLDKPAEQFQRERPLTFKAISICSDTSWKRQCEAGQLFREEIGKRAIVDAERSLDLILACQVSMVWQFYFTRPKSNIMMCSGICRSIIADMRLIQPVQSTIPLCPKMPAMYDLPEVGETRTDEERRVLLTNYSLSAMIFMSLKLEPCRWARQFEEHCEKLASNHSIPGDQVLVAITRIFRISNQASQTLQSVAETPAHGAHIFFQIRSLNQMLEQIQMGLTPEVLRNKLVLCYLHCTTIIIHEIAIFSPPEPVSDPALDFQRISALTACLHACKATLEAFTGLKMINTNMATVFAWTHAMQVLFRLSVLELPGWDRQMVRATADVLVYLSKAADMVEAGHEDIKKMSGGGENMLTGTSGAVRSTLGIWREHLVKYGVVGAETDVAGGGGEALGTETVGLDGLEGFDLMDTSWLTFPDEVWLSNVFGSDGRV
ncbi:hypothetical protein CC80DRAFT_548896 [Byssothecium circinans]|uniref:Zn(2)-C6 fungal-type domain-containing protein n=1 Tax=Byssothecium circinans TaxID=147558 RepID=A0A6A5TTS5_9PLEO|nr:hypothetical protein CC80DRAFT_548896 [Byssothecium circinans]